MEMFSGSDRLISETYMMPGTGLNPQLASTPALEEIDYMGNETAPDFMLDQGLYYPAAANYYGYYCTGFESPNELDDHHRFFGSDGQELQSGLQTDGTPYAYYTPSYEYAQSPYDPYNPYFPGAVIGFDSPYIGTQQYLTGSLYQQPVASSAYVPIVVHSSSDVTQSFSNQLTASNCTPVSNRPDSANIKYTHLLASTSTAANTQKLSSGYPTSLPSQSSSQQPQNLSKISDGFLSATTHIKQPSGLGVVGPARIHQVSQTQRRSSDVMQTAHHISNGRDSSVENPSKRTFLTSNGFTSFGSNSHGWDMDKPRPGVQLDGSLNNRNGTSLLADPNRAPRTFRSKGQCTSAITVRAYGTKSATGDAQGNIVICADQYNREDFPLDYPDAKFFVIKSYSEDDVHKSIKYNVWSSTPNGNKKLDAAYEEAQRISVGKPKGCPVFLFFSVNASGHFCGVGEMVSPVDFSRDMDFWQQDKWIGSFPVRWHMIKDVPNTSFRHIILENNENRPVTSSRDTQEVPYLPGLSMLHIFKSSLLRTSVLDDFMFYEERQKVTEEERSRLPRRGYNTAFALSSSVPSERPSGTVYHAPMANGKQQNGLVPEFPRAGGKQLQVIVEPLPKHDSGQQNGGVIPHVEVGKKSYLPTIPAAAQILTKEAGKVQAISVKNNMIQLQAGVKQGEKEPTCLADQPPETDGNSARVEHLKKTLSAKGGLIDPSSSKNNSKPEPAVDTSDMESVSQIGSLPIEPKRGETYCIGSGERESSSVDVVTVGSMHIRVDKNGQSSLVDKGQS